jgi:macrolide transport system ATP-binding/permease protein
MNEFRPQLALRDLVEEALASLTARPGRAVLTALGTVLGVAALVATLGLSKTAGNQIVGRFDALAATDITVTPKIATSGGGIAGGGVLPWDAEARVRRLNGVVAAGTLSDVDLGGGLVRSVPVNDPVAQTEFQMPVKAASPGLWQAVRADLAAGRLPDAGHSARGDRVAVVGANMAEQLHATRIEDQPAIFLGDKLFTVIGVLESVSRQSSLLGSVVIPEGTAERDFGLNAPGSVQIETRIGAANLIAGQLPLALSPPSR